MTKDKKDTDLPHSAILNNDFERVEQFMKNGADFNTPNDEGLTPLQIALMKNNKKMVELLLNLEGNYDTLVEVDMTAWIYAIMLDDKEIIDLLLIDTLPNIYKSKNSQGETLVHYCVKYRSLNTLNLVADFREIINEVDMNGYSALHLAIIQNDLPMVKRLLELGANVYAKTKDSRSPIHFAVKYQCFDTLLMLIEANVDLNDPMTSTGAHPLHIAVENNDISTVNLLIRSGVNYLHCTDNEGKNLLHVAVKNQHEDMIKLLLKRKVDVNARFGEKEKSVLDLALSTRNSEIITTILNYNPDLNSKDKNGLSAIFNALKCQCLKSVNEIFSLKPDLDVVTNEGLSLLHYALIHQHERIVNYLLENNINIDIVDDTGFNALHCAAKYGDAKVVSLLINKNFDVNARTKTGYTPLHFAVLNTTNENVDIVNILLNSGAEVNAENTFKVIPLFLIKHRTKEVFKLLLDKGANVNHFNSVGNGLIYYYAQSLRSFIYEGDVFSSLIERNINFNKINAKNDNIFHFMAERNLFCVNTLENHFKNGVNINGVNNKNQTPLNVCLENGAFPDMVTYLIKGRGAIANKNEKEESPLHLAIKAQQYATIHFLLENGAGLTDVTVNRSSILHYAVLYNKKSEKKDEDKDILKLLLEYNVDDIVNAKNDDGKTPLHLAVLQDSLEMVETLFNKNINVNVKDGEGNSPLSYAISNKNLAMVKFLLKKGACTEDRHRDKSIYDLAKESGDNHIYQTILLF